MAIDQLLFVEASKKTTGRSLAQKVLLTRVLFCAASLQL